jgi:tetratricopeptide (TPR) repeat protein
MGNVYFEQGKYPSAIKSYRMALDALPTSAAYHRSRLMTNIGLAFVQLGQYADAASTFESALDMAPEHQVGADVRAVLVWNPGATRAHSTPSEPCRTLFCFAPCTQVLFTWHATLSCWCYQAVHNMCQDSTPVIAPQAQLPRLRGQTLHHRRQLVVCSCRLHLTCWCAAMRWVTKRE